MVVPEAPLAPYKRRNQMVSGVVLKLCTNRLIARKPSEMTAGIYFSNETCELPELSEGNSAGWQGHRNITCTAEKWGADEVDAIDPGKAKEAQDATGAGAPFSCPLHHSGVEHEKHKQKTGCLLP